MRHEQWACCMCGARQRSPSQLMLGKCALWFNAEIIARIRVILSWQHSTTAVHKYHMAFYTTTMNANRHLSVRSFVRSSTTHSLACFHRFLCASICLKVSARSHPSVIWKHECHNFQFVSPSFGNRMIGQTAASDRLRFFVEQKKWMCSESVRKFFHLLLNNSLNNKSEDELGREWERTTQKNCYRIYKKKVTNPM